MKRITFILSVILLTVIFTFTASASVTNFKTDADGAFDVVYTGTAGAYYAVIVVEGIVDNCTDPAAIGPSIQYFDQQTADDKGSVKFADIYLKASTSPCSVFVSGSDIEKPILLGYANNEECEFTVSGTITSQSSTEAMVSFVSTTDPTKVYTTSTTFGSYTIKLPADTYTFIATKTAHLSYTKNSLEIREDTTKNVSLKAGDIIADGVIDFNDFSEILKAYMTSSETVDIDGDGKVDFNDFSEITKNYMLTNIVE